MKMFTAQKKQAAFSQKSCKNIIQKIATFILQFNYLSLESEESISTFLLQSKSWLKRTATVRKNLLVKFYATSKKEILSLVSSSLLTKSEDLFKFSSKFNKKPKTFRKKKVLLKSFDDSFTKTKRKNETANTSKTENSAHSWKINNKKNKLEKKKTLLGKNNQRLDKV